MIFNSWIFPCFFILVLALYYSSNRKWQNHVLLVSSYVFYGYWDPRFLLLIFGSTLTDYFVALCLSGEESKTRRKWLVTASCVVNLGVLAVFKYNNFFLDSLSDLLSVTGYQGELGGLAIVLPVGISFYTFQTLSYTIDVYRRTIQAERNFLTFALFVSYFPQLVAGPIERASNLLPQLNDARIVQRQNFVVGGWLILKGCFLKMVIADNLAIVANEVFGGGAPESSLIVLIGILAFTFQIYGDFAGYSKIARGVSVLLGIQLMRNFDLPYLSRSPSEFWQRWHISLSSWLRDYLYIPLGGNRGGAVKMYRNLLLTMVIGGLWHGAAWTFVAWGTYHGILLVAYRLLSPFLTGRAKRILQPLAWPLFFGLTCFGWLLFRAESFQQVIDFSLAFVTTSPFHVTSQTAFLGIQTFGFVGLCCLFDAVLKDRDNPQEVSGWSFGLGPVVCSSMILAIVVLTPLQQQQFVYFQF